MIAIAMLVIAPLEPMANYATPRAMTVSIKRAVEPETTVERRAIAEGG
jgi:hypothetical protein